MSDASPSLRKDPAGRRAVEQSVGLAFRFLFIAVGVLAVAWLASGFVSVEAGSRAVVMRFGVVERIKESGLVWAWPRPLEEVIIVPGSERPLTQEISALDRIQSKERVPAIRQLDLRDGGYVMSGDGGVAHMSGVVTYRVSDAAAYLLARERLAAALERVFCASAIVAIAGRALDGVLVAPSGDGANAGGANAGGAQSVQSAIGAVAQREALRGDIRVQMNQRLKMLHLGIEITRVDLTGRLPARAKPAFDQVLAAGAEAAQLVAAARTSAETYRQEGEREKLSVIQSATAKAKEAVAEAHKITDPISALAAESSPEQRRLLLTRLYRERMENILRRAGLVTLVDGREPIRLMVPGGQGKK
jgi:regulator of protease activity HflC (stomatin/prohibitin superfamily)